MSFNNKDSSARSESSTRLSSGAVSPTHGEPQRYYESVVRSDDEELEAADQVGDTLPNPTGTVRRHRSQGKAAVPERSYGTMEDIPAPSTETPLPDEMMTPVRTQTNPMNSPELAAASNKPRMLRKVSTKHAPHRGQEFSVDDDPEEYESDVAHKKASQAAKASGHVLRRKSSTIRRRNTHQPSMPKIDSKSDDDEAEMLVKSPTRATMPMDDPQEESSETAQADGEDDEDSGSVSDAESFTLKDKQQAINQTHPFGIRIWKPALYKKNRSVEKTAEGDIHSKPGASVSRWLAIVNVLWTVLFGWWLAVAAGLGALLCFAFAIFPSARPYGRVFFGLAHYLFYPFGKFVKLEQDEAYAEEDEGEGRSISEYEQWQQGDLEDGRLFFGPLNSRSIVGRRRSTESEETQSLLGRTRRGTTEMRKKREKRARLFGRGEWTIGRVLFFLTFYFLIAPLMLLASLVCWLLIFWVPMARATGLLFYHLRRHPLALSFYSDTSYSRPESSRPSSILLCTYRAAGLNYWKYTIDGTNIFLINLIGVVFFVIFDYFVLGRILDPSAWIVHPGLVFALALFSVIPLAYFIGQAVASISAQSSMGVGAAINAFFSTVVEVFLYCVALNDGKGPLVEGSIIGSIFAGILFLPGLSMCFGAINRKTQRFNVKSAGVTSTMLLFATIAAFSPTLFYQIYGSHELNCHACALRGSPDEPDEDCRRCYFTQSPTVADAFFMRAVRPYCWFAAILLFLSYLIGLWFTLRTHAAVIWNAEVEEKKAVQAAPPPAPSVHASGMLPAKGQSFAKDISSTRQSSGAPIREGQLYKRILQQTLKQDAEAHSSLDERSLSTPHVVPPKSRGSDISPEYLTVKSQRFDGLSEEDSSNLYHRIAEMAASAATVAAKDLTRPFRDRKASVRSVHHHAAAATPRTPYPSATYEAEHDIVESVVPDAVTEAGGGHDAPNWGRTKSVIILLGATILYAIIAEILVSTVDVVLESVDIDEKFLGITLFALVPNTTEFLNAISFAVNGNIALSMEIGSAYALQVFLLQIPALVLFSAVTMAQYVDLDPGQLLGHTFSLIFPQWDMVTVILCVFLLSYVYSEGKSNYFKGSVLVLAYLVIVVGFYLAGYQADNVEDILTAARQQERFGTVGRIGAGKMAVKL